MNEVDRLTPDQELLTRYACGPIRFSGHNDALYERHLLFDDVVAAEAAGPHERFKAAARSVRDVLSQRWILTDSTYNRENPKRIYYLSMEFLIGRSLSNNITNLLLDPFVKEFAARGKLDPLSVIEQEPDAGLGNGGLGRWRPAFSIRWRRCSFRPWATGYVTNTGCSNRPSRKGGSTKSRTAGSGGGCPGVC